jgi:hypothetical protein
LQRHEESVVSRFRARAKNLLVNPSACCASTSVAIREHETVRCYWCSTKLNPKVPTVCTLGESIMMEHLNTGDERNSND